VTTKTQLEAPIRTKIKKFLERTGAWVYHPHGAGASMAGAPDLLVCYKGRFLGLEVKRPGKNATELQAHTLEEITEAGGVSSVVYSVEDVKDILSRVDSESAWGSDDSESFTRRQTSRSRRSQS
jgi:Holliday junction resolvase